MSQAQSSRLLYCQPPRAWAKAISRAACAALDIVVRTPWRLASRWESREERASGWLRRGCSGPQSRVGRDWQATEAGLGAAEKTDGEAAWACHRYHAGWRPLRHRCQTQAQVLLETGSPSIRPGSAHRFGGQERPQFWQATTAVVLFMCRQRSRGAGGRRRCNLACMSVGNLILQGHIRMACLREGACDQRRGGSVLAIPSGGRAAAARARQVSSIFSTMHDDTFLCHGPCMS